MANTLNKQAFAAKLVEAEMFSTKKAAVAHIEALADIIKDEVIEGNSISIPGFGKFENFTRQDGTKSPKFRPFEAFRDAVKG